MRILSRGVTINAADVGDLQEALDQLPECGGAVYLPAGGEATLAVQGNFALRWFRGETRARLAESGDRTIQILGGYVRGTVIIATVDAVVIGLALFLLGVPLALPLAVFRSECCSQKRFRNMLA